MTVQISAKRHPGPSGGFGIGPGLLFLLVGATLLGGGCTSTVDHPQDVQRLLADSPAQADDGFRPLGAAEQVRVVLPPPEPYRLGIGDVVYVSVPGQEKFTGFGETSTGDLVGTRVKEDGKLYLPLIRAVPVVGKTALQVQEDIQTRLREFMTEPFVSVDVLEHRSQKFYVLGEITSPGVFPVDGRTTLIEAVSRAGGLANGSADVEEAYVVRKGRVMPISLADVLQRGDVSGNLVMQHGDLVFVPHLNDRRDFVYVLGEVQRPGAIPMEHDEGRKGRQGRLTLTGALAVAGGLDAENAAEDQIRIFRGGWKCPRVYTLSAHEIYKYGESLYLRPGDRILVAPTGLATWGRALGHVFPFLSGASSAAALAASVAALNN